MLQDAAARRPPPGIPASRDRSVLARFAARSSSRARGPARGRAGRVARKIRRLRRGAPCRGQANPHRSGDLLFQPRRGFERLSAREAVAAAEPGARTRSARTRSRPRRAQSRPVGDRDAVASARASPRPQKSWRRRWRAQGPLRRDRRLRRSLPDDGHAGRDRPVQVRPRAPAALCGDRVQHVRPRQRAAPGGGRANGAARRVDFGPMQARVARGRRHRGDDPRRRRTRAK